MRKRQQSVTTKVNPPKYVKKPLFSLIFTALQWGSLFLPISSCVLSAHARTALNRRDAFFVLCPRPVKPSHTAFGITAVYEIKNCDVAKCEWGVGSRSDPTLWHTMRGGATPRDWEGLCVHGGRRRRNCFRHCLSMILGSRSINFLPRFPARFSSPDSNRWNLATSTFTERYVNILIALFQYDWRAYRLHAREAQVWPPPSVSYFSQRFFSLVLQVGVTARHPLVGPPWPSPQQGRGRCEQMPRTSEAAGTHKTGMGGTSRNVNAPAPTRG